MQMPIRPPAPAGLPVTPQRPMGQGRVAMPVPGAQHPPTVRPLGAVPHMPSPAGLGVGGGHQMQRQAILAQLLKGGR